jgi:hypothetical protein
MSSIVTKTGEVIGDVFNGMCHIKRGYKHYCYRHGGFGIPSDLPNLLREQGIEQITLEIYRNGKPEKKYIIRLDLIERNGIRDIIHEKDGEQIFLPVSLLDSLPDNTTTLDQF